MKSLNNIMETILDESSIDTDDNKKKDDMILLAKKHVKEGKKKNEIVDILTGTFPDIDVETINATIDKYIT